MLTDFKILQGFSELYRKAAYLAAWDGDSDSLREDSAFCQILRNFVWNDELKFLRSVANLQESAARSRKLFEYKCDILRKNKVIE